MRYVTSWLIGLGLAAGLEAGATTSFAQPNDRDRDHREHDRDRHGGPIEAPPPPREEKMVVRAGFEWLPGRWDWRGNAAGIAHGRVGQPLGEPMTPLTSQFIERMSFRLSFLPFGTRSLPDWS